MLGIATVAVAVKPTMNLPAKIQPRGKSGGGIGFGFGFWIKESAVLLTRVDPAAAEARGGAAGAEKEVRHRDEDKGERGEERPPVAVGVAAEELERDAAGEERAERGEDLGVVERHRGGASRPRQRRLRQWRALASSRGQQAATGGSLRASRCESLWREPGVSRARRALQDRDHWHAVLFEYFRVGDATTVDVMVTRSR